MVKWKDGEKFSWQECLDNARKVLEDNWNNRFKNPFKVCYNGKFLTASQFEEEWYKVEGREEEFLQIKERRMNEKNSI